jgi:hypothetical protein
MKTSALLVLALAATVDTVSAVSHVKTLIKIEDTTLKLSVEGTYAYTKNESFFDITMGLGSANTGEVELGIKVTLKTPSCKPAEAEISLDGSAKIGLPAIFTTPYNVASNLFSSMPAMDDAKMTFTKSAGTGEKLEFPVPVSSHPMMKVSGTGVDIAVDLTKAEIMKAGIKIPLSVTVKVLDTDKVDVVAKCQGTSNPCGSEISDCNAAYSCVSSPTGCATAYGTLCTALESAFPDPLISVSIDVWDVLNKAAPSDMFVKCGDAMCLAIGDVAGSCDSQNSLDSGRAANNGAVHMVIVALLAAVAAVVSQE